MLELSGEAELADVRELTLRGRRPLLTTFEPACSMLPGLEALSLSGNQIATLAGFSQLRCLSTLNLNNNQLASLDGLQHCSALQASAPARGGWGRGGRGMCAHLCASTVCARVRSCCA